MTAQSTTPNSARHRAREVALQALFALDLQQRPRRRELAEEGEAGKEDPGDDAVEVEREDPPEEASQSPAKTAASGAIAVFESVAENFEMPHAAHDFARYLVVQVIERSDGLDEIVAAHAKNWRISRMAVVDRNILRLATFELAHTGTAAAIVLDEAVELARRFGSDESPPFVNGVLDAVARKVRKEEFK